MVRKILICLVALSIVAPSMAHADTSEEEGWRVTSGVRLGYAYLNNIEDTERLKSPHTFLMGFEMQQAYDGGSWLNFLVIQNVVLVGMEQSVFAPSLNVLVGFEINDQVQFAVGGNLAPFDPAEEDNYVHMVGAIGYTADVGEFSIPLHVSFVPDVNGFWRVAATTGVNW